MNDPTTIRDNTLARMDAAVATPSRAERFAAIGLLSHADARRGGEAMFDRWEAMARADEDGDIPSGPPFNRDDAAWADLFRAAYEAIR